MCPFSSSHSATALQWSNSFQHPQPELTAYTMWETPLNQCHPVGSMGTHSFFSTAFSSNQVFKQAQIVSFPVLTSMSPSHIWLPFSTVPPLACDYSNPTSRTGFPFSRDCTFSIRSQERFSFSVSFPKPWRTMSPRGLRDIRLPTVSPGNAVPSLYSCDQFTINP